MSCVSDALDAVARRTLLEIARAAIRGGLVGQRPNVDLTQLMASLRVPGATFVTLEIDSELRGCIGTLEAHRPLALDVAHNAHAAAYDDPRFAPLANVEFERLQIHISLLSSPEPLCATSEADLIRQVRPGIDGLILQDRGYRATLLPAVWESVADPREFLSHLKRKAGLPPDHWSRTIKISRYTVDSIR
jgi:AmmeMemoRadiSam system protein A